MAKRILFILLIGLTYCGVAKAQQGLRYNMKISGETATIAESRDSADFYRIIFPPDTVDKRWFIINDYYKDGKPKLIGKTSNADPRSISLQGMSISYFANGEKKAERNFKDNRQIGEFNLYFPNGKLYLAGNSDEDGKLIVNECRDSTGKVLVKDGNGHYVKYNEDFQHINAEGNVINGLEDGEWHGFLADSATYVCTYVKGVLKDGVGYDKKGISHHFTASDFVDPSFKGGPEKFANFIGHSLKYPSVAKQNNVQGKVFVSFVVNKDGHLSDFQIIRGIGSGCDEEVIRVMKLSPPWTPGTQFGIPVSKVFTIPVSFTLSVEEVGRNPM